MSNVWIFHHNDGDGYASAAVVASDFCRNCHDYMSNIDRIVINENVHLVSVNFNKPIDFSEIQKNDTVYMLDYTPSRKDDITAINNLWVKYGEEISYVHIDHHKSALAVINECEGLRNYLKIQGGIFPTEIFEQAGCMLTYISKMIGLEMFSLLFRSYYFGEETPFPNINIKEKFASVEKIAPEWLKWTADHDIYAEKYPESHMFAKGASYNGLFNTYLDLSDQSSSFLYIRALINIYGNSIYESKLQRVTSQIYQYGCNIKDIMDRHYKKCLSQSFEIYVHLSLSKEFLDPTDKMKLPYDEHHMIHTEGKILCVAGYGNSDNFLDKFEMYDAVILFNFDGDTVRHSIYSKKSSSFPCNVLALWGGKFFGISGGGHDHAAGFYTNDLFFRKEHVYFISDNRYRIVSGDELSENYKLIFKKDK